MRCCVETPHGDPDHVVGRGYREAVMGLRREWRRLAREFQRMSPKDPSQPLVAEYYARGWFECKTGELTQTSGASVVIPWNLVGQPAQCSQFQAVARTAAVVGGLPDGPHAWWGWLEALRGHLTQATALVDGPEIAIWSCKGRGASGASAVQDSPEGPGDLQADAGDRNWRAAFQSKVSVVHNVCEASAQYRTLLAATGQGLPTRVPGETDATDESRTHPKSIAKGTGVGDYPKRAAWLKREMTRRKLSASGIFNLQGPSHHTVGKILKGRRVTESTLEKLAQALSFGRDGDVTRREIPDE